jgi:uncharacterized protein (DUF952 family)
VIFKIVHVAEWRAIESETVYCGSPKDKEDGFLHFSTQEQLLGTLKRHYSRASDLLLVAVDGAALGEALSYEPSTAGALYPHLFGALPLTAVQWARPITLDENGEFVLPL